MSVGLAVQLLWVAQGQPARLQTPVFSGVSVTIDDAVAPRLPAIYNPVLTARLDANGKRVISAPSG